MQSDSGAGGAQATMPIAIVGIGCRFPGRVDSADGFWRLLLNAVDATSEVPGDRWNAKRLYGTSPATEPGTVAMPRGGFVEDIAEFDAGFFGISPREAAMMDPQQRLLLEASFNALENAGHPLEALGGRAVGVFVGIAAFDYAEIQHSVYDRATIDGHTNTGTALSIAANRISYLFDFRGPSLAVDTACSSSLVALHLACQSLAAGECSEALVGGVNAILKPEATVGFSAASMLALDGRCKTFDAHANGYTRGEGAGAVALKPLSAALEDNDRIYAVIKGTVINQDGHTPSMTVPGDDAQAAMLRQAYQRAGIDPGEVRFMEAHGTGTPVGDPIEIKALGSVLGARRSADTPCYVGSVKTNIGHLEAAAGIAGLIKAALAVHHGVIPANLNFQGANPALELERHHFVVPTRSLPWPEDGRPRRAGVNSFGFGGANAHVVLEQSPAGVAEAEGAARAQDGTGDSRPSIPRILAISARSEAALQALTRLHVSTLHQGGSAVDLETYCRAATRRRSHHGHRLAVVAQTCSEFTDKLNDYNGGLEPAGLVHGAAARLDRPEDRPAFVFSGMGPQWWAMGRELLETEPLFREWIARCDQELAKYADWSLLEEMRRDEAESRMGQTQISQPANFALQAALTALWRSWGITPSAVVGHSTGEIAAAYAAGALDFESAIRVAYHRSRLQQRTSGTGAMAAAGIDAERARAEVAPHDGRVSVAAVNGPSSVTLSGDSEPLAEIVERLSQEGVFVRRLAVDVPFHSHRMEPLEEDLRQALEGLSWQEPAVPLYSTVTGAAVQGFGYDADYWWRNVREPVLFARAIESMIAAGHHTFLEVGPHPVLSSLVAEGLSQAKVKGTVLHSLKRREPEKESLLVSLARLYVLGHDIDWSGVYPGPNRHVELPEYPWQREHFWQESAEARSRRLLEYSHPLLGARLDHPQPCWTGEISLRLYSYMDDHQVRGSAVFPAAGYVELALAAGREIHDTSCLRLEELKFENALVLAPGKCVETRTTLSDGRGDIALHSRPAGENGSWTAHLRGRVKPGGAGEAPRFDTAALRRHCPEDVSGKCYATFEACGLDYGPSFQGIDALWRGEGEAFAVLRPLDQLVYGEDADELEAYVQHPSLMDACFQALIGTMIGDGEEPGGEKSGGDRAIPTYLPVAIEELSVHAPADPSARYQVYVRRTMRSEDKLEGDIFLLDEDGNGLAEIRGLSCKAMKTRTTRAPLDDWLYAFDWERQKPARAGGAALGELAPARALADTVRPGIKDLSERFRRERYYQEIEPLLDRITAAYAYEAFARLGAEWTAGEAFTLDGLSEGLRIAPRHRRLVRRLLQCLAARELLEEEDADRWRVRATHEGDGAAALTADCRARYKEMEPELALIERCGTELAGVLRGETDPVQVLFPDGAQTYTEPVYARSRSFATYNEIVERAVRALLAKLPAERELRILEIGSGTGALASRLLPLLPQERTRYVYTDVSSAFLLRAEEKFAQFDCLDYQVLDIEKPPLVQGFEPDSFDLVLAGDVLHATSDLARAVEHAASLLAPRGMLVLLELTAPPYWFDLTFGQLKGWWTFEDGDLRPDHACIDRAAWTGLLHAHGLEDISILSDRLDPEAPSVHSVILSTKSEVAAALHRQEEEAAWALIMDDAGVGDRVKAAFEKSGHNVVSVSVDDRLPQVLSDVSASYGGLAGVVYLPALDAPTLEEADASTLDRHGTQDCLDLLKLVQTLDEIAQLEELRLVAITRGLHQVVDSDDASGILAAPLWGLGRVVANEYPGCRVTLIDLPATPSRDDAAAIHAEASLEAAQEAEVAWRDGERYVARLRRMDREEMMRAQLRPRPVPAGASFYLDTLQPGALDNLILRQGTPRAPGPGEVEIAVRHASLNFRDLMKATGIYPTRGDEPFHMGDECSGVVTRVGPGVENLAPGDGVAAVARGFASPLVVPADFAVRIPDALSFEQAATIPIAFLTAWYALHELARIREGERVLIHAAAGGVGLAAVQIAQNAGAEVFATASSDEKHAHLKAMGVKHIMNSRTLAFYNEILDATGGEGVDIVLNSLAGDFIPKSLKLLRPYGRFLELGKTDIYQNNPVGLAPFRNNLSYFAIDLDRMFQERPARVGAMLREVMQAFGQSKLAPLPATSFDICEAERAYRYMAQAKHIGKIVFDMHSGTKRAVPELPNGAELRRDASYLLTGGLGGFGLAVAEWMARQGAGHLILSGRRGRADGAAAERIRAIERTGAKVTTVALDVTDEAALAALLKRIDDAHPPLAGVVHMAMVLHDDYLKDQTKDSFRKVLDPKTKGAWNLHRLTAGRDLDLFVMFSSFAAVVGNPGQGNYVAANLFLDALAQYRRAQGLPGLAIAWGPIADVGYVAQHEDIMRHFDRHGLTAFKPDEAMQVLEAGLRKQLATLCAIQIDWSAWAKYMPELVASSRFQHLAARRPSAEASGAASGGRILTELQASPPSERPALLEEWLVQQLASVLACEAERIDRTRSLADNGVDSLISVELACLIEEGAGVDIASMELAQAASVSKLTERLLDEIALDEPDAEPAPDMAA